MDILSNAYDRRIRLINEADFIEQRHLNYIKNIYLEANAIDINLDTKI